MRLAQTMTDIMTNKTHTEKQMRCAPADTKLTHWHTTQQDYYTGWKRSCAVHSHERWSGRRQQRHWATAVTATTWWLSGKSSNKQSGQMSPRWTSAKSHPFYFSSKKASALPQLNVYNLCINHYQILNDTHIFGWSVKSTYFNPPSQGNSANY